MTLKFRCEMAHTFGFRRFGLRVCQICPIQDFMTGFGRRGVFLASTGEAFTSYMIRKKLLKTTLERDAPWSDEFPFSESVR